MAVCITPHGAPSARKSAGQLPASQFLVAGDLALRICGPGQKSRVVRIRSAKCTVGSAKGCTLRLVARGVEALECWILRGCGGTIIRRLNGGASLNGAHFDEAMLTVGDHLTIGQVELVVEDCGITAAPSEPISSSSPSDDLHIINLEARLDRALDQIQRLEGESRQGFESSITAAGRAEQLRDALTEANQQLEEVCSELTAAQATIDQQSRELFAAREIIEQQTAELQGEQQRATAAFTRPAAANGALERHAQSPAAASNTAGQIDPLREPLAAANQQLEALQRELSAAQATIDEQSRKLVGAQETIDRHARELRAEQNRSTAASATMTAANGALEKQNREMSAARDALQCQMHELELERVKLVAAQQTAEQNAATTIERLNMELAAARSERAAQCDALQQIQQTLAGQRAASDDEKSALLQRNEAQERELNVLREQLTAKIAELAAMSQQHSQSEAADAQLLGLQNQVIQSQAAAESAERRVNAAQAEADALRQQLRDQAELQTRVDQLAADLQAKERDFEQAQQAVANLETKLATAGDIDQQNAAREQQKSELAEREAQLSENLQTFEAKRQALEAEAEQLTTIKQQLAAKESQLSEAALQIERAQQAAGSQHEQSNNPDQRMTEIEARATEIATRLAELDRLFEQLIDQRASLAGREQDIGSRERDFHEHLENLNRQAEQFQVRREQLDEREAQLQEREGTFANRATEDPLRHTTADIMQTTWQQNPRTPQPEATDCDEPTSGELQQTIVAPFNVGRGHDDDVGQPQESSDVNSVLGRLATAGVLRDDNERIEPTMPQATPAPPQSDVAPETTPPPAPRMIPQQAAKGDDEESIESYMQRLMKRVRGDVAPEVPAVTKTTSKPSTSVSASAVPPEENIGSTMVAPIVPQSPSDADSLAGEVAPRRPVPDAMTNLSAMREVANSAALAAINQHVRTKASKGAQRKLLGACLTLAGSAALAYFAWEVGSTPGVAGAAAGGTIAAYWLLGAALGFIRLKRAKQV